LARLVSEAGPLSRKSALGEERPVVNDQQLAVLRILVDRRIDPGCEATLGSDPVNDYKNDYRSSR
jgi:hypothetical protein